MSLLDKATNYHGRLSKKMRGSISEYLNCSSPTAADWSRIYCVVINAEGRIRTVWQAVTEVDPTFPREIHQDKDGNLLWPRVPDPLTVARALKKVLG